MVKFVTLAVLTWGIYDIYWFYKNWKYVRNRDGTEIMPFWRAVFSVVWYYPLLKDMRQHHPGKCPSLGVAWLIAGLYFLMVMTRTLPEPFGVVTVLSFVFLLPAVKSINAFNSRESSAYKTHSEWRLRHNILLLVSGPLTILGIGAGSGILPPSEVVPGWRLWPHQHSFLVASDVVDKGEHILYFYSDSLFSIRSDGSLLTDRRVTSYWEDEETGELIIEKAAFGEIVDVLVEERTWADPTYVTIIRSDGSDFTLLLPTDDQRDRTFLRRLDELRAEAKRQ